MRALMPRCSSCVLCGKGIKTKGRIDRIYCSASCRTLAWRVRAGHRFDGRRKAKLTPQPGDFVARKALPLLAVRMKAELDAAKRRIAELEAGLGEKRGDAEHEAMKVAGVATAAIVGAAGLAAAIEHERNRVQHAEQERARADAEAEKQRHQTELATEREGAALREAELQQRVTALTASAEQATAREQAAESSLVTWRHEADVLRQKLHDEANDSWKMTFELASLRTALLEARTQSHRHHDANREKSRQLEKVQSQLTALRRQLGTERREWKAARAKLTHDTREGQQQVLTEKSQLQNRLGAVQLRAEIAESAMVVLQLQAKQQERDYQHHIEELERKQLAASDGERKRLSTKEEDHERSVKKKKSPKQLPGKKREKQLPARAGTLKRIAKTAVTFAVGAASGIGLVRPLGDGDRKKLPSKRD